ncbi:unnamed protein product [Anisakis simplex]|uniref:Mitogen-activated protein kinase kinase kinase n=1 Tax=Anisakis simplex TaxID=6269 RepID=A0A0M3JV38_ANISI|nr:unnamed protein product [Anisakis simplex]
MKTDDDNEAQGKFKCTLNPSSIECSKTIGRGSFGLVKRATLALHSQRINVAVKILSDSYVKREKEAVANELRILRDFEHINIVKLYGCFKNGDADPGIGIVLELMSCSLEDLLYTFSYVQYKCSQVVEWMLQCSKAIAYLHDNATVHRDLKPANLLLNQTFRILKVSDFGTARLIDPIMSCRGTSSYMAPEVIVGREYDMRCNDMNDRIADMFYGLRYVLCFKVILGKEYDMRCDVYSIGIILSELMTRQPPQNSLGAIEPQIIFRVRLLLFNDVDNDDIYS